MISFVSKTLKTLAKVTVMLVMTVAMLVLGTALSNQNYDGDSTLQAFADSGVAWKTTGIQPTADDNTSCYPRNYSSLTRTQDGYMRVFPFGTKICIEYYNDSFNIIRKGSVPRELDTWGGFYAGSDGYYYVITGKYNTEEKDSAEVIRVTKYDSNWNRVKAASITSNPQIFGGEVRYPFNAGCVKATEYNGNLYIVTGHEGYVDPDIGQGHQGYLMIKVNKSSMTGSIVASDLRHSFAQYIDKKGNYLYILEKSEGNRYTKLRKYDPTTDSTITSFSVFDYGGHRVSALAKECYASVDEIAISSNNILCIGTSIDQSQYDNVNTSFAHNIYLTVTPINNFSKDATSSYWLTNYSGNGESFVGLNMTKINDNKFMISWEMYEPDAAPLADEADTLSSSILHYMFIDGSGNVISPEYTAAATISDCEPILVGSKVVFYSSNANSVDFYSINTSNGAFSKRVFRTAGEAVTWNLSNGTLTLSGRGAIKFGDIVEIRIPLSSVTNFFVASADPSPWSNLSSKIKTVDIKSGITSIPEKGFQGLNKLEMVNIEDGLTSIGKEAFFNCPNMKNVNIPASVTSIGEDILWTGSYWVNETSSHVYKGRITAPCDSYAIQYAKNNSITCILKHKLGAWEPIPGVAAGNQRICQVCGYKQEEGDPDEDCWYGYGDGWNDSSDWGWMDLYDDDSSVRKTKKKSPAEVVDLPAVKISKPKAVKRAVTVKWKKVSKKNKKKIKGIEIQIGTDRQFNNIVKSVTAGKGKTSKKIKGLKSKTKYWVRIRAYKYSGKVKHVSAWKIKTFRAK